MTTTTRITQTASATRFPGPVSKIILIGTGIGIAHAWFAEVAHAPNLPGMT